MCVFFFFTSMSTTLIFRCVSFIAYLFFFLFLSLFRTYAASFSMLNIWSIHAHAGFLLAVFCFFPP